MLSAARHRTSPNELGRVRWQVRRGSALGLTHMLRRQNQKIMVNHIENENEVSKRTYERSAGLLVTPPPLPWIC